MSLLLYETLSFIYNVSEVLTLDNNESHKRSTFAKRLTYLRQKNGYTQESFAIKAGFSRGRYANYEQGRREPDFEIVKTFADILNCTTDYLLGINDSNTSKTNTSNADSIDLLQKQEPKDLMKFLEEPEVLFGNKVLSEEDKAKIKASLDIIFWDTKQKTDGKNRK